MTMNHDLLRVLSLLDETNRSAAEWLLAFAVPALDARTWVAVTGLGPISPVSLSDFLTAYRKWLFAHGMRHTPA